MSDETEQTAHQAFSMHHTATRYDLEDAVDPLDLYQERVRVASYLSRWQVAQTTKRLDASTQKEIRQKIEFIFDR